MKGEPAVTNERGTSLWVICKKPCVKVSTFLKSFCIRLYPIFKATDKDDQLNLSYMYINVRKDAIIAGLQIYQSRGEHKSIVSDKEIRSRYNTPCSAFWELHKVHRYILWHIHVNYTKKGIPVKTTVVWVKRKLLCLKPVSYKAKYERKSL